MDPQRAAEASSVPESRTLLKQRLVDLPEESLELVQLLASQLVTNAVRHRVGPVHVRVTYGVGQVRV